MPRPDAEDAALDPDACDESIVQDVLTREHRADRRNGGDGWVDTGSERDDCRRGQYDGATRASDGDRSGGQSRGPEQACTNAPNGEVVRVAPRGKFRPQRL